MLIYLTSYYFVWTALRKIDNKAVSLPFTMKNQGTIHAAKSVTK